MAVIEIAKIKVRRGQELQTGIPKLDPGEFGWAEDTENLYIGKRISEGADSDENTRILVERDLDIFKTLALNTGTVSSAYRYRDGVDYIDMSSQLRTVQSKLDDSVSLFDFGVNPLYVSNTGTTVPATSIGNTMTFEVSTTTNIELGMRIVGAPTTVGSEGFVVHISTTAPYIVTSSAVINTATWSSQDVTFYGQTVSPNVDITSELTTAVQTLFNNIKSSEARRKLRIPAGNYVVTRSIELPPYSSLIGEGMGLTNIVFENSTTSLFKTVDAEGNEFGSMLTGVKRSRDIRIEGMTIQYSTSSVSNNPLISLDDVSTAYVEDCRFGTYFSSTSTTTYGLISTGTGISLRGTGGGVIDVTAANNIHINNCIFDGLNIAIEGTGTVVRPVIENNVFNNLQQGVKLHTIDASNPPQNGYITENRFQNIVREAIYVGTSSIATNHLSSNNFFAQVGNGTNLSDYSTTSSSSTAVISFIAKGNKTINDQFNRRTVANSTSTDLTFYYNPLVVGSVVINDSTAYDVALPASVTTPVARIGLTGRDQKVTVNYQITNNGLSRKGNLLVNIAPDGYASYTDYYNYSQSLTTTGTVFVADTTRSGLDRLVIPIAGNTQFASVVPELYYITGVNNEYQDFSAIIRLIDTTTTPGYYTILTQSIDPTFDYSTVGLTWQLAYGDSALPDFSVNSTSTYLAKNYVMLECLNSSQLFPMNLQYQIDVQQ
jgi:hypothetical protein